MADPRSGEEKVRQFQAYLEAHPEIPAQWPEAIAAGERGEGVPFRVVYDEWKKRREEERRRDTNPPPPPET